MDSESVFESLYVALVTFSVIGALSLGALAILAAALPVEPLNATRIQRLRCAIWRLL